MVEPRSLSRALVLFGLLIGALFIAGAALAALPPGGTFTDDNGNIHEGNIEAIAAEGITFGCNPPANTWYCPSRTVTREQMAAFIVRGWNLPATGTDYFDDDYNSPFEDDINRLAAAGVTNGCNPPANNWFCPGRGVTRGEMAAFINRVENLPATGTDYFSDDDGSIFEDDINRIAAAGITVGCGGGKFCPNDFVKRDQMASFIARALGLDPIWPPPFECIIEGSCSSNWPEDPGGERNVEAWRSLVEKHWQPGRVECVLGLIHLESHGDPQAVNSANPNPDNHPLGLLQHVAKYWNGRAEGAGFVDGNGITASPFNGEANIAAGRWLADWAQGYYGDWRQPWGGVWQSVPACVS